MAQQRSFLKFLITLIFIAAIAFGVIYFFFPDISEEYLNMSWESRGKTGSEAEQAVDDVVGGLTKALKDAGADDAEIEMILSRADVDDIIDALEQAAKDGKDEVSAFVNSIGEKVDFGDLDMDVVKDSLGTTFSNIDFSGMADQIKDGLEKGIKSLGDAIKDAVN